MDFPITLLKLAGSVALLLWGVHMVQSGVQRAFGAKLRSFLSHALRTRLNAFLAGILAAEKEIFRKLETEATSAHFERPRAGRLEFVETRYDASRCIA